jgi:uncharacterized protein YjbI with pentapeptide repeats
MDAWILISSGAAFVVLVIGGVVLWWPSRDDPGAKSSIGAALLTGAVVSFAIFMLQVVTDARLDEIEERRSRERALQDLRLQVAISPSLEGFNFRQGGDAIDLSGFYFAGKRLVDARFIGITLDRANFNGADLRGAFLDGASLRGANLASANLENAKLPQAILTRADLTSACLRGADLRGANLRRADLTGANLGDALYDTATFWPRQWRRPCPRPECFVPETPQPEGVCT